MAKSRNEPSYVALHRDGTLQQRISAAGELLRRCTLCPHQCGINRLQGELGLCRIGAKARVAGFGAHFGEESTLVGRSGSGTIFFAGCNLLCDFCQCQNYKDIASLNILLNLSLSARPSASRPSAVS